MELERALKETAWTQFVVVLRNLSGGTEEGNQNIQSR
jgi:hypothetical protein